MSDPLKGINVDAAGGASKVLKMLAEKVRRRCSQRCANEQTRSENPSPSPAPEKEEKPKEGVVAKAKKEQLACEPPSGRHLLTADNSSNFSTGRTAASLTSTTLVPEVKNERAMYDEEERECTAAALC